MKKAIVLATLFGTAAYAANVTEVKVKPLDGFGGDAGQVVSIVKTRVGSEYDETAVAHDVANLKASGNFQDVSADAVRTADGVEVTFFVTRKMRFHGPLAVEGAEFFKLSKIASESKLKDGYLYGEGDFADAASRVADAYRKKYFPFVKVVPRVEPFDGSDGVKLTLVIEEGERLKPRNLVFEGADKEYVEALNDKVRGWPWWNPFGWFLEDIMSDADLAASVFKIEEFYGDLGYLDAKVTGVRRESVGPEQADIVFTVEEGTRYKVGSSSIKGLTVYSESAVREKSAIPADGEWASLKTLAAAARSIEIAVGSGEAGLADTKVTVRKIVREDDPSSMDIVFDVEEGTPVIIDSIVIDGNDYTKDKVIRREITLSPGDRMLENHAESSKRRLENLDYFKRVRYYLRGSQRTDPPKGFSYRDLVYEVEEKGTGAFQVGVGASSVDSIFASVELSQANFDLFAPGKLFRGAGQKGRLFVQVGPRIQSYEAAVTEPWLFDRQLEFTVEAHRRQRWYDEYDVVRSGASASISYPVKFFPSAKEAFGRFGARLSAELVDLEDVDDGVWTYKGRNVSLREEERKYGDAFEPVAGIFWSRDTRDTFRFTKSGSRTYLFCDVAPGGDNKYWKVGGEHRSYFTPWEKMDHVLMLAARVESIDGISDDVPIYNRMFLGGPRSVRGIEYRHVSPMARKNGGDDWSPWGGQTLFCANAEYTVPVFKLLRIAAFTDVGSVSAKEFDLSDDFAWTAGIGLRIDIPQFPVRLDFAAPIKKPDHADKEVFSFTVGYDF